MNGTISSNFYVVKICSFYECHEISRNGLGRNFAKFREIKRNFVLIRFAKFREISRNWEKISSSFVFRETGET
jgi:hypothetical protein